MNPIQTVLDIGSRCLDYVDAQADLAKMEASGISTKEEIQLQHNVVAALGTDLPDLPTTSAGVRTFVKAFTPDDADPVFMDQVDKTIDAGINSMPSLTDALAKPPDDPKDALLWIGKQFIVPVIMKSAGLMTAMKATNAASQLNEPIALPERKYRRKYG